MTITQHQYGQVTVNGTLIGRPSGGTITMDETWSPHIQARLEFPYTAARYAACDPRIGGRVAFNITRYRTGFPTQGRTVSLVITGRSVDHARGILVIDAASDEFRLQSRKHVASTPNESLLQWQTTNELAQRVIEQVLVNGQITTPWESVPIPVRVSSRNLVPNPSAEVDLSSAEATRCTLVRTLAGSSPYGGAMFRLNATTDNDSFMTVGYTAGTISNGMQAGGTYTASGTIRLDGVLTGPNARARRIVAFYRIGTGPYTEVASAQAPNSATVTRLSVTFTIPENASEAFVRYYMGHTGGVLYWDGLNLVEHVPGDVTEGAFWDGDTSDTADYVYQWDDAPGVSTSSRIALVERAPDAFILTPGDNFWEKMSGLFAAVGLRWFNSDNNLWRLVDDTYVAPEGVRLFYSDLLEWEASIDLAAEDDEWCDAAVVRYFWTDWTGTERERFDAFGPATPKKTRTVEINRPFPGPGLARNIVSRSSGYADSVRFSAVAEWVVRPTQPIAISMPDASLLTALVRRVTFDLSTDTMEVETRGVTTPPPDAWVALPSGQRWTDSPVGGTWIGETIG